MSPTKQNNFGYSQATVHIWIAASWRSCIFLWNNNSMSASFLIGRDFSN